MMEKDTNLESINDNLEEKRIVYITLEDDTELECVVLGIFDVNDREYIAVMPTDKAEDEEGEVYLYRYNELEDGTPELDNIETDEEFEIVQDAFEELLDEEEFFDEEDLLEE